MNRDLDELLSRAFHAWSQARAQLARLRTILPHGSAARFAASPGIARELRAASDQEDECERLFGDLLQIAEDRAQRLSAACATSTGRCAPGVKVLVVDDNQDIASSTSELLRLDGYEVSTCFDGERAVWEVFLRKPDLALFDVNMPSMGGVEAARRVKALYPDLPIIAVTAAWTQGDLKQPSKAWFDGHIDKPVDPVALLAAVRQRAGRP